MLTTVSTCLQPRLAAPALTLVYMPTFTDRLKDAMGESIRPVDLAKECKVSRAAVAKWLSGNLQNMKMENLFTCADYCRVNARWLATGKGPRGLDEGSPGTGFEPRHLALLRTYTNLPKELRIPIRQVIETANCILSSRHREHEAAMEKFQADYRSKHDSAPKRRESAKSKSQ